MTRRLHKITLDNLHVLDAIDRHGSFAAAARELCVVTSSVTHVIRNMEDQLELTLFDRTGRGARFTSEGRALLAKGRQLLASAARFDAEVQLITTGWEASILIALDQVIRSEPLLPLIDEFVGVAPQTSLQLLREAVAGTWDALLSGRADLIVGAPAEGPSGGGYESRPLYKIRFVFAAAPGHPLVAVRGVIPNNELARHRSVLIGDTTRDLPRWPLSLLASRTTLVVPDANTRLHTILRGNGCGFVPARLAAPYVRSGKLVLLRVEAEPPPGQSVLAWRAGENGRALRWWIARLARPALAPKLIY